MVISVHVVDVCVITNWLHVNANLTLFNCKLIADWILLIDIFTHQSCLEGVYRLQLDPVPLGKATRLHVFLHTLTIVLFVSSPVVQWKKSIKMRELWKALTVNECIINELLTLIRHRSVCLVATNFYISACLSPHKHNQICLFSEWCNSVISPYIAFVFYI